MIEKEVEQFVRDMQLAYDPTSNSFAIYNIDPAVMSFLWHIFNCSQRDHDVKHYIDQFHLSTSSKNAYSNKIVELLITQKYSQAGLHNIKSEIWKKLDTIFEDMKEVMDEDS